MAAAAARTAAASTEQQRNRPSVSSLNSRAAVAALSSPSAASREPPKSRHMVFQAQPPGPVRHGSAPSSTTTAPSWMLKGSTPAALCSFATLLRVKYMLPRMWRTVRAGGSGGRLPAGEGARR